LRHIVMSEIAGCFHNWGALLLLDAEDPSRARLTGWVDLTSIDTGSPERDAQIRSSEFFNVVHFPVARFRSEMIAPVDGHRFVARGPLELHGVVQPIELTVTAGPRIEDGDVVRPTYEVHGTIDRQAFGLHWNQDLDVGGVVVGDRIDIRAHVEAVRVADPTHFAQSLR
jgi:polyisoprenoid-binding protein YceI